jgi:uncharacterized protein
MAETLISPGVLTRENDLSFIQTLPLEAGAAFIGPTVKGPVNIPTPVTSYSDYVNIFGTTFTSGSTKQEFLTSIAVKNYFSQGGDTALITRVASGSFTSAESTYVSGSVDNGTSPFTLKTLGQGILFNNSTGINDPGVNNADGSLISGSEDNIRWEVTNVSPSKGTFTLLIRRGDDSARNKVILETWNNLSLDPESENYIEKFIGNQYRTIGTDGVETYVQTNGEFVNRSRYVYVHDVGRPTLGYLSNDGITVNEDENGDPYSESLPTPGSGSFYGATGDIVPAGLGNYFDKIDTRTQGLLASDYDQAIRLLSNQDEYIFNIVSTPGLIYSIPNHAARIDNIISRIEARGDAIVVVDLERYNAEISSVVGQAEDINSSYAATYWPWLQVRSETGKNVWVPASTVIPGVFAFTDNLTAPWFAPAGLIRGGIPGVIQAERKLSKGNRDSLYEGKVNPIATFPGAGIAVFGQKTLQTKASALDRVNVRRLLIELKKFFSDQARNLVFEQNTINTRNRFLSIVTPYMESVVQRQGLFAFRIIMDETNNSNDVIDRNQLVGQIFIQPAKTAEFIILDFTVEPTGATFVA